MADNRVVNGAQELEQRAKRIESILAERGIEVQIEPVRVWKNNILLDGITAKREGSNIAPTVYIDKLGDDEILQILEREFSKMPFTFNPDEVINREYILKNVRSAVVEDSEFNRNELDHVKTFYKDWPTMNLLELFEIPVNANDSTGFIKISESMLNNTGITPLELMESAHKNMGSLVEVKGMSEILRESIEIDLPFPEEETMFVITVKDRHHGAGCIVSASAMFIAERRLGKEFYILPSSIHELIAIPVSCFEDMDTSRLLDMVREVNATQVAPEDRLADAVYLYNDAKVIRV